MNFSGKTHPSRRAFLRQSLATPAVMTAVACRTRQEPPAAKAPPTAQDTLGLLAEGKKIPVIFDSDIGNDIDDTWALVMALKSSELEIKLVATDAGNTTYRSRLAAKLLENCGRSDIPIGIGIPPGDAAGNQSEWVGDYTLDRYPGTVYEDGVAALIRVIKESPDPVTVVAIGGVPNVAAALNRDPTIVENARFVGMHGSIRIGYDNSDKPVPESNVRTDPAALAAVFAAPWESTITPLDTCGLIKLDGERYQKVLHSSDAALRALIDNYRLWSPAWLKSRPPDVSVASSILFDTVAVYLAFTEDLVEIEALPIGVTDDGMTVIDETKRPVRCATRWRDLAAYHDFLVERLLS